MIFACFQHVFCAHLLAETQLPQTSCSYGPDAYYFFLFEADFFKLVCSINIYFHKDRDFQIFLFSD